MSYQVIARKWRPKLFDEVVGQVHVTQTLKNAITFNRIAHAYIFSGPRGVGKTTVARILARSLNCEEGPTVNPCNTCPSCTDIISGSSVDVLEIDGASNTGVDNVRDLRENIRYVPTRGKYRVYIIDEVHMLSVPAFNALLKTLEEPPPHAIFIFATTEVHKVPATILSRCQRFDFKRISLNEVQSHLQRIAEHEKINVDTDSLYTIAREADGSMRDGQSLLDQVIAFAGTEISEEDVISALGLMGRPALYELLRAVIGKDSRTCLNTVEKIYNFGYDQKRLSADILECIRNLTVVKVLGVDGVVVGLPDSELETLRELTDSVDLYRLHMIFDLMARCHEDISRSAFPRFLLEMTLLKASHIEDVKPLAGIIKELEELRSGTNGSAYVSHEAGPPVSTTESFSRMGLLEFIKGKRRHLASCLDGAKVSYDGSDVNIEVNKGVYSYVMDNKADLNILCGEFFNSEVNINIGVGKAGEEPENGVADALVKEAVRIFNGKVIDRRRRTDV